MTAGKDHTAEHGLPGREIVAEHLLRQLRAAGGHAATGTLYETVAASLALTSAQRDLRDKQGRPLYKSEIRFARRALVERGDLHPRQDGPHGVWQLTEQGMRKAAPAAPDPAERFPEGAAYYEEHRRLERDGDLVALVKAGRAPVCEVCGFDFGRIYGPAGEGYIECHHTVPVAEMHGRGLTHTALETIALLCANCHRMAHLNFGRDTGQRRLLTVDELRGLLKVRVVGQPKEP